MLKIRLQRVGKRNQPEFRVVLAEKHKAVKKKALEILGYYNPRTKKFNITDEDRLQYWLGQNVETSPTVHNLLVEKDLISGEKVQAWRPKVKKAEAAPAAEVPAQAETREESAEAPELAEKAEKTEEKSESDEAKAELESETPKPEEETQKKDDSI